MNSPVMWWAKWSEWGIRRHMNATVLCIWRLRIARYKYTPSDSP